MRKVGKLGFWWCRSLFISLLAIQLVDVCWSSIADEMKVNVLSSEDERLSNFVEAAVKRHAKEALQGLEGAVAKEQDVNAKKDDQKVIVTEKKDTKGEQVKLWYTEEHFFAVQVMVLVQYTDKLLKEMVKETEDIFDELWEAVEDGQRAGGVRRQFSGIWGVWGKWECLEVGIYYVTRLPIFRGIKFLDDSNIYVEYKNRIVGTVKFGEVVKREKRLLGVTVRTKTRVAALLSPCMKQMIGKVLHDTNIIDVENYKFWPQNEEEEKKNVGCVTFSQGTPSEKREVKGPLVYLTYHIFETMLYGLQSLAFKYQQLKSISPLHLTCRSFSISIETREWAKDKKGVVALPHYLG